VPAFAFLKEWATRHNINVSSNDGLIKDEAIKARIMKEVETVNQSLAHHEQIKKIELLPKEWSIEGGEMTPKLSLKRKIILTTYKTAYEAIYGINKLL